MARTLASGPLAKSLFDAGNYLPGESTENLGVFLDKWRLLLLDELANDPYGRLGRKYPSLAAGLPSPFPNPDIFRLYCHPLTTQGIENLTLDTSPWVIPKLPDSSKLAGLCNRLFNWGPDILSKFTSTVWDGYFIRLLVKVLCFISKSLNLTDYLGVDINSSRYQAPGDPLYNQSRSKA